MPHSEADGLHTRVVRERPLFAPSVAAAGGVLIAAGTLTLFGELADDDGGRMLAGVLSLLLAGAAVFAAAQAPPPPLPTACVAVAGVAVGTGVFLLLLDPSDVSGASSLTAPFLFAAIAWVVLFLAGPTKGRPFLLALALVAAWGGALSMVDPVDDVDEPTVTFEQPELDGELPFDDEQFRFEPEEPPVPPAFRSFAAVESVVSQIAWTSIVFGVGYALAAAAFDRRRQVNVATPFIGVGLVALAVGLIGVGIDVGEVLGALFALVIGGAVSWYGGATGRRASTWLGAFAVAVAALVFVDQIDGEDNRVASELLAVVAGGALVAVAALVLHRVPTELVPEGGDDLHGGAVVLTGGEPGVEGGGDDGGGDREVDG